MKNFTKTIWLSAILLFVMANVGWGQIAAWQLYGNSGSETSVNATTLDANLNTSTLARGSGLNSSGLVNAFSSTNFTASGTKADAISANKFVLFTINSKTGYKVSLSTLDVRFRRSGTGPNTFRWQYSTDGTTFTDIGSGDISYTLTTAGGDAQAQIDLSGITALQNVENATTITIRLLGWGASSTAGTFAIGRSLTSGSSDYSLAIGGTVTPTSTPTIVLSSPNPSVAAGSITQSTTNNVIYRFDLAVTTANATLSGLQITTAGTYAAADLTNLKAWYSSDATFNSGSDVLLSTKTTSLELGTQVFPSWTNQVINNGTTGYIFITTDIPCGATSGNTINVNAVTTSDITFLSGNKSGTAYAGGTQTFQLATPSNVTSPSASSGNTQSILTWTNPMDCFNEIMIVAKANSSITGIPTGDGSSYTASTTFGSGTSFDGGYVVYKGSTSGQTITNLTNGTTYYFKFFTRNGTNWSSGVEINATPSAAAPTVTTQTVSSIGVTSATGNGNITSTGGVNATEIGVCWDIYANPVPDLSDAHSTETGSFGTGTFTGSITGVSPETRYKVVAYATNPIGTGYGSAVDFWTLSIEPSTHTITFSSSVISQVQIDLSFDAASTITNADGYIILQRTDLAPTSLPTDGNAYSVGNTIGDATVAAIITSTSATSTSITGLTAGTEYYFTIMPYNYDGSNDETYNYKTDGTIPGTHGTTSAPNDDDSFVEAPASQVNPGTISSLIDTDPDALEVFKFKIVDKGTDGVQTKVTQVTINDGSNNTANWSNTIQGVKLSTNEGSTFVTIGTATINASSIVIPITSGNLNIDNGGNAEVSLFIYLETSGLTDNQILEFNIPTTSHGFIADETGSTFATTFASATTSNQVSIEVTATELKFVQQPSNTNVSETMSPAVTIETTDENGNRDLDKTDDVNLASSGTMTGTPTASLTSGFGTFSDIIHTETGTGLTLTASLSGLTNAVSNTFDIATYYTWNTSGTTSWTTSTNWTPERTTPETSDVLLFNSGTTVTVTDVPIQTIAMLLVSNSTIVNLQAGAANTLTISGGTGTDLSVDAGCQLNIDGTNALIISLSTGATGSISGSMTFSNAAHQLTAVDASAITFENGSTFTAGTGFTGNAFGTSVSNSVIFTSGSTYIHQSGSNPFGASQPSSVVVFQSGSLYKHESTYDPAFSGRTYADFELDVTGGTITPSGTSAIVMDNLTITNGTLNFNVTESPGHSIKGDITVSSGATLNFEPTESGTINLNGSSAQSISGSGTLTFGANSNLEINNSNGITLNGDVTIDGTLTLTSGLLILGDNNLTLGSSATITGVSSSNYILTDGSGVLIRNSVGSSETIFPVGISDAYSPVWITNEGTGDNFSVRVEPDATGSNSGADRIKLKWEIAEDVTGGSDLTLKIGWMESQEGANFTTNWPNYAKLWHVYSGSWIEAGDGDYTRQHTTEPYTMSRGEIENLSPFAGGKDEGALPVELISFTSSTSDNSVNLTWSTAVELNNSGFDVERKKTESSNWQKIGFVEGHGTTNTPQSYSFPDRFLLTGKYNYRLKQIDFNGNYHYYTLGNEVSIGVPKKFELSQNFPNPFNPVTNISYKLPGDSKVSIKIFDILGREVRTLVNEFKTAGYHTIDFDGSTLSSGMYFYRIKTNGFEAIKKMLLIK